MAVENGHEAMARDYRRDLDERKRERAKDALFDLMGLPEPAAVVAARVASRRVLDEGLKACVAADPGNRDEYREVWLALTDRIEDVAQSMR